MCTSSPHPVGELDAAWAVCYWRPSREAQRCCFPSHSQNCPQWHNQRFWQNSLVFVAHFGICGECQSPGQLIFLASMESIRCNQKYRFACKALASRCPCRHGISLNSESKCWPSLWSPCRPREKTLFLNAVSFQGPPKIDSTLVHFSDTISQLLCALNCLSVVSASCLFRLLHSAAFSAFNFCYLIKYSIEVYRIQNFASH